MIAIDNSAIIGSDKGGSYSVSYTCTGSNLILLAFGVGHHEHNISAVTYNGVALTQLYDSADSIGYRVFCYYLIAPATGNHTLVFNFAGGGDAFGFGVLAQSYTGVHQTSPFDNSRLSGDNLNLLVNRTGCWLVGFENDVVLSPTYTAGSGTTIRQQSAVSDSGTFLTFVEGDSNGTVTPGLNSLIWSPAGGANQTHSVTISLRATDSVFPSVGNGLFMVSD